MTIRPMLAPNNDPLGYPNFFKELKFPFLISPKLDGIRMIPVNGVCMSRTMTAIPNGHSQFLFGKIPFKLDGELGVAPFTGPNAYNITQSCVMSRSKPELEDKLEFHVFDIAEPALANESFEDRLAIVEDMVRDLKSPVIKVVPHTLVRTLDELLAHEQELLGEGYEGVMLRSPGGRYKFGRATWREQSSSVLKTLKVRLLISRKR